jgi:DNA-binding FadR family transcriptional regulator
MTNGKLAYEFLDYLVSSANGEEKSDRLPSLNNLSEELGLSVSRLREQLEVARALGFVEARPRTGIRRLQYSFLPAIKKSLSYAISLNPENFEPFADLRKHIEAAYWHQAVIQLTLEDHGVLRSLLEKAWEKLRGNPIQIPQAEHRALHLQIFRRLENPFVLGLLEAYWDAYEEVGLNVYADYYYLHEVWKYHQQMVDAICRGDYEAGYNALVEHTDLIYHRPFSISEEEKVLDQS